VPAQSTPQLLEAGARAAENPAFAAESAPKSERVGRQLVAVGGRRLQPREERFRIIGVDLEPLDLDHCPVAQLECDEAGAVGPNPEVPAPGARLPFGKIVGQASQQVADLAAEIGLELEHRSAEKHIGTATHLG
jgi:hypothetical protein